MNHREVGGNPEMFLETPIVIDSKQTEYSKALTDCAKRFPAYKKYLGRGTDWYGESGMSTWLIKRRKTNKLKGSISE